MTTTRSVPRYLWPADHQRTGYPFRDGEVVAARDRLMPLRHAGYREIVFTKSMLAQKGALVTGDAFHKVRYMWSFDPATDEVIDQHGNRYKVTREGSASKAILEHFNMDHTDCFQEDNER